MSLAFQSKDNILVLYTTYRYAWSPLAFGVFATVLAVATILFQAHVTARVERRFGQRGCALLGSALQTAGFGAIGLAWNGTLFGWLIVSSCRAASRALRSNR
jgi:Na+/melibiose symporter-like transporter